MRFQFRFNAYDYVCTRKVNKKLPFAFDVSKKCHGASECTPDKDEKEVAEVAAAYPEQVRGGFPPELSYIGQRFRCSCGERCPTISKVLGPLPPP